MGFDDGKAWLHYFRRVFSLCLVMEELARVSLRREGGWSLLLVFNAHSRLSRLSGHLPRLQAVAKAHFPTRNVELTREEDKGSSPI